MITVSSPENSFVTLDEKVPLPDNFFECEQCLPVVELTELKFMVNVTTDNIELLDTVIVSAIIDGADPVIGNFTWYQTDTHVYVGLVNWTVDAQGFKEARGGDTWQLKLFYEDDDADGFIVEFKNCFQFVTDHRYTALVQYYNDCPEFDFLYNGTVYNQLRLPMFMAFPQHAVKRSVYRKSTGVFKRLSTIKHKEWQVDTNYFSERQISCLEVAVDHNFFQMQDERQVWHRLFMSESEKIDVDWKTEVGQNYRVAQCSWKMVEDFDAAISILCGSECSEYGYYADEPIGGDLDESDFHVVTLETDLNYLLNTVNDEELVISANNNNDVDTQALPMKTRLLAMGAKGRYAIGLSDERENRYIAGDDTTTNAFGHNINGTRFDCGDDCDGSEPAFDKDAILNGAGCKDTGPSSFGQTLDYAVEEGSRVIIPHNARVDLPAETLIAIASYQGRIAEEARTDTTPIICLGNEYPNPSLYCDPNNAIFADGAAYRTAMEASWATIQAAHPNAIPVVNTAHVFKDADYVEEWNDDVKTIDLDVPKLYGSMYIKTEDLLEDLDGDDSYNPNEVYDPVQWKEAMNDGVFNTLPSFIALFKTVFTDWGIGMSAFGQSGGKDKLNDFGTANAALGHALMCRQILMEHIADPEFILYCAFYKPGSMQTGNLVPRFDWWIHTLYALLFEFPGAKMCTVDTGIEGVYGVGVNAGGDYTLFLINDTDSDHVIGPIDLDGDIHDGFTGSQYGGSTRDSQSLAETSFTGTLKKLHTAAIRPE